MINLIGNEFKKIFKKKTIYILLIITIGYIVLSNIMTKITNDYQYGYYFYDESDVKYYESKLSDLDPNNVSDLSDYIDYKKNIELINLAKNYEPNSWQIYIIDTNIQGYLETMIEHQYSDEISDKAYNEAKKSYDEAVKKLNENDWKFFANKDLESVNSSLEEQYNLKESTKDAQELQQINQTIYSLEIEKRINEWRLEKNIDYSASFLNNALNEYENSMTALSDYNTKDIEELDSQELQEYREYLQSANLNKYYIENNLSLDSNSRSIFLNLFGNYEVFIILIGIVIAGSIVSEEFNRGTIKLLLVKPYNRIKILMSKFIVCILILLLSIGIIYISQLLIGGLINGFDGLSEPAIVYDFNTNKVEQINIFAYVALLGICKLPIYILLTTLAFTCSTLFTNTAISVAVPFLGYIASSIINQFALLYDLKWIIYFVTPNWDLTCYLFGGSPLFEGLTAPFSIIICVIYLILLLVISSIVFKKRDIKNI